MPPTFELVEGNVTSELVLEFEIRGVFSDSDHRILLVEVTRIVARTGSLRGTGVESVSMSAPGPLLRIATLSLLTLIWGTTWAAITISLRGIPPFTGVALRFAIASVLLFGYARLMRIPLAATNRRDRRLRVLHALLSFCVSYGVVFWAEQWAQRMMDQVQAFPQA